MMSESSEQPQESPTGSSNENASLATRPAGINDQENADTQRSLQQASLALEVTLNRIVEVRRSLLRLTESLPNPDFMPRFNQPYNDIRPGHEALLLAGDRNDPETRGNASRWASGFEGGRTGSSVPPRRGSDATWTGDIPPLQEYSSDLDDNVQNPPLLTPPPLTEVGVSRRLVYVRHNQSDPAATTRGLRVAAREANGRARSANSMTSAQEYESLLDSMVFRPMPPQSPYPPFRAQTPEYFNPQREPFGSMSRDGQATNRDQRQPSASQNVTPPLASWRAPDPRRWRLRQNTLVSTSMPSSEFPRPPSVTVVMREPRPPAQSHFGIRNPGTSLPSFSSESAALLARTDEMINHHYRQLEEDFNNDTMGNNVNIDWSDEDFISWLFPAQRYRSAPPPSAGSEDAAQGATGRRQRLDTIRQDLGALRQDIEMMRNSRLADAQASAPERSAGRRRGWARLDADGNEISSDEEEELERSRTEYRLGALQRARHMATQPSGHELPLSNIFLERNGPRDYRGSVLDSTLVVQSSQNHDHVRARNAPAIRDTAIYVDPLPMPLASMAAENRKKPLDALAIIVPKNACLAGR